jgi:NAD(P)-dependent dehydrogenase (short-subunit alcohol dehydrogenase family)
MVFGRFNDKVGLVTAGARGIGAATARAFASEGAHVVIVDIDDRAGADLYGSLSDLGYSVEFHQCDASDSSDVAELLATITKNHGRLDFAANVVGGLSKADVWGVEFHEMDDDAWDGTLQLALRTTYVCLKHEVASMLQTGGGSIVNVSAMAANRVMLYYTTPAYASAKAGVNQLTRYVAVAYADRGIRVNAVSPGITLSRQVVDSFDEDAMRDVLMPQAIKRASAPEDQANAILWLCSDAAEMVTGHVLPVDGGWDAR